MLIELEYPFCDVWRKGYLYTNPENRKHVALYNSDTDRTCISYARYLVSVDKKRFLTEHEVVDHIDDDKTHDELNNLQILTKLENAKKEGNRRGRQKVIIQCPICSEHFSLRRGNSQLVESKKGKVSFCSKMCKNSFLKLNLSGEERTQISVDSIIGVFIEHE